MAVCFTGAGMETVGGTPNVLEYPESQNAPVARSSAAASRHSKLFHQTTQDGASNDAAF